MTVNVVGTAPAVDLGAAHRFAVEVAEAAGRLLRRRVRGEWSLRSKGDNGDLVTDLDLAAERLIVDRIRDRYPDHGVIAEEGGAYQAAGADWTWLVDPLDGTNNLAIGLPAYVVGIALCRHGSPVVGVVHDPVRRHTWSAIRGQGAFVRSGDRSAPARRLLPPHRPASAAPVLAWTQGHAVPRDNSTAQALKVVLDSRSRRVLQLWAPLLSWVMLARGDIDGIVGYQPEAVDLPAGLLLATEAGMVIRSLDGGGFDDRFGCPAEQRSFVAGPPQTIGRLVGLVGTALGIEPRVRGLSGFLPPT